MKTKNIIKVLFTIFLTITVTNCGYNEDLIEELAVDREFAPVALSARVRNQTTVELNWTADDNVEHYIVEFSADDPNFGTIFLTVEVTANQLPIQIALEGETLYSIRVKAISGRGLDESKWSLTQAQTLTEQIMLPSEPGDIGATQAILRWPANSNVTHFIVQPGDIRHDITSQEKIDGVATITGLTGETDYTAILYNNTKVRGSATFTTGIDVGDNTLVLPTDDLFQMIADAAPGDILLLEQGDYTAQTGMITLDKSITIQGLRTDFKPLLKVAFSIVAGAIDVSLIDLDLEGDGPDLDQNNDLVRYNEADNYNSLLISGCNIHNYKKSFIAADVTGAIVQNVSVENCIVTDMWCNGGDFIDFRTGDALNITVNTSTFNNCASSPTSGPRDFFRFDAAGTSNDSGVVCNINLESSTLYNCSSSSSRRIMYVRFLTNKITVKNVLIAETQSEGYMDRSGITDITFDKNNYFNAPGFFNTGQVVYDTGNYTTEDPGFVNAAAGNFKITNQTLLDNQVGDPRWRQ